MQADRTGGTLLFTIMHNDSVRTQVYVPQDEAIGVTPGVDGVVRVPKIPGRTFPGKVTRCAATGNANVAGRSRHPES